MIIFVIHDYHSFKVINIILNSYLSLLVAYEEVTLDQLQVNSQNTLAFPIKNQQ